MFVVAGTLRDSGDRRQRSMVPLLRDIPEELHPLVFVLDLATWDRTSDDPQILPLPSALAAIPAAV